MANDYLSNYLNFLLIEKGLSKNTVSAYRRDLERLSYYVSLNKSELQKIKAEDLVLYIAWLRGLNNNDFQLGESACAPCSHGARDE